MSKLTQEVVDAAETAVKELNHGRLPGIRSAITELLDACHEQLGQQAAAPGVEARIVMLAVNALEEAEAILGGEYGDHYSYLCGTMANLRAALAVAPPPVGSDQARELLELALDRMEGENARSEYGFDDEIKAIRTFLSTPPVRPEK